MQIQQWTVYSSGRLDHVSSNEVDKAVRAWRDSVNAWPDHPSQHVVIPDHTAQTIAAWWHTPGQSYTTLLSTMGRVDRYTTLDAFGDPETDASSEADAEALRALGAYILAKQEGCTAGYRPCACHDCFMDVVGRPGELCPDCSEHGCDPTDPTAQCEVPGGYGDE